MKLPIDIDALLRGETVEWARLEFKSGWNPKSILRTLCAFANDFHNLGGGYVVVGVEEKDGLPQLPPVGINPASMDDIQKELLRLGHVAIRPTYHPVSVPYELDGKWILVIWAPGGESRPYRAKKSLKKDETEYVWYIRKGSNTIRAKGADENELLRLAANIPFDDRANRKANMDELSCELIVDFLNEVGSDLAEEVDELPLIELARQMQIVTGADEAVFPRNVGLMFFNEEPRDFFPNTQIDVVWFPEGPGGDTFTEKIFDGPIHHMIQNALDYVKRSFLNETIIKHPDRPQATRVANFPFAAIEEAVVNAVYHRSYELREPVEIRIDREKIVILSYPGPDRSVKIERLREGRALARRYRNRRIGEFLKELDLTEGRGTGIPKILRAMRENGSPDPIFEFDDEHSYFQVELLIQPNATAAIRGTTEGRKQHLDSSDVKTLVLQELEKRSADEQGLSNAEIRRITSLNRQKVTRLMNGLRDEERVELEGHGRGAVWKLAESSWNDH